MRAALKLSIVAVNNNQVALIVFYPFLISLVESGKIVDAYASLEVSAALLNLRDKVGHR